MVTKQRSDKRTAHISNRVRRNAPISSSMMPRGDLSSSMVRYCPARAVRLSERLSTYGMPMSTANMTILASGIADTSLRMVRAAIASASAGALSGSHPSLSYQSAGSGAAGAHHPALFSRRARQPARRLIPARVGDANSRGARRLRSALRFCRRHPVTKESI
jgi:hypothetical protein